MIAVFSRCRRKIIGTLFFAVLIFSSPAWAATVYINLVTLNPSAQEAKDLEIKYYLPKELKPDDILNTAGLKFDYDIDAEAYYVYGTITLAPKESKTIRLEVKDVWVIENEEVDKIKKQIEEHLAQTRNTKYYKANKLLSDKLLERLDYILTQQENFAGDIERRVEEYRAHADILSAIRNVAFSIEYWHSQQAIIPPAVDENQGKTVNFVIETQNPDHESPKLLKQQIYLPQEVRSDHIVDSQGFEVRYDETKNQSYLYKEEQFAAGEKKNYTVIIKDIWRIAPENIEGLRTRAQNALDGTKKSPYAPTAKYLMDSITARLDEIAKLQIAAGDINEHVGAFRKNKESFQAAEDDVLRMERILYTVRSQTLEDLSRNRIQKVFSKFKALAGITAVSQAVFGRGLSGDQVWLLIWGVIIFVGVFTAIHFLVWLKRSRDTKRKVIR